MAMTQQEVIKKFMASLDKTSQMGISAVDEAIKACSKFSSAEEVIKKMLKDCKNAKSADDFLKTYCGINLDNDDTGAIIGKDAGGPVVKTAESIVPESKALDTSFTGNSFTVGYLTVKLGDNKNFSDLNDKEKSYWQALKSYWIENALNLIKESYGNNFSVQSSSKVKVLTVTFTNELNNVAAAVTPSFAGSDYLRKTTIGLNLDINQYFYNAVNANDKDGKPNGLGILYNAGYLDRNIAHELTHAIMHINIDYCNLLPRTILEGMAELTHGIDDTRKSDLKELAGSDSKLEQALEAMLNYTTANIENVKNPTYSGGYMFLRYLARQVADIFPIYNTASNTLISGSNEADYIVNNGGEYVTINGGAGNDTVLTSLISGGGTSNYASINAGDGNDIIYTNFNYYVTTNGGNGNDTITDSAGYKNYHNGGAGNDIISVSSNFNDNSINGGSGNDTIYAGSGSYTFIYESVGGNDVIYGVKNNDTIKIIGGTPEKVTTASSNDVTLKVGSGSILVKNAKNVSFTIESETIISNVISLTGGNDTYSNSASGKTIYALAGNDSVYNDGNNVTIDAGAGNDTILNYGSNVTIQTGEGNDSVGINNKAKSIKIYGGAGNDSVNNWAANSLIDTGADNDYIFNSSVSANTTINGGAGNDRIINNGARVMIDGGNGDDYINNNNGYDTAKQVTLNGDAGNDSLYSSGVDVLINGGADNDYIHIYRNTMNGDNVYSSGSHTVNGGAGNDSVVNYSSKSKLNGDAGNDFIKNFGEKVTINAGTGNDSISLSSDSSNNLITYANGDGNDIIYGIKVTDTLQISGTSYSTTKSGSNVIVSVGSGKISVIGGANISFKIDGIPAPAPDPVPDPDPESVIFNNAKESLATAATLTADFEEGEFDAADYAKLKTITAEDSTNDLTIYGNKLANRIIAGDGNDYIHGGKGADTLTGNGGEDTFVYIYGDGNKVITDYTEGEDRIEIQNADVETVINSASIKGSDVIFKVGTGKITVKGGDGQEILFVDEDGNEYIYPNEPDPVSVIFNNAKESLATAATITADYEEEEFDAADYGKLKTITAEDVSIDLTIYGNKLANKIIAGEGNDYIHGGKGADTLTGGGGEDTFAYIYGDGNKVITDYTEGEDRIEIQNADVETVINSASIKGSDVIFKVGTGKITVKGGDGQEILFVDEDGNEYIYPNEDDNKTVIFNNAKESLATAATITADFEEEEFDAADYGKLKTITAEDVSADLTIYGNKLANKIIAGDGNDYIYGGKGTDTLTGGGGEDTFAYVKGDGNKVITDYTEGEDRIEIQGADVEDVIDSASIKGSDVIFKVGTGKITVKGGKGQEITFVNEDGDESYSNSRTLDILYDNNFMTDDTSLDSIKEITATNYSVTEIQPADYLNIAQDYKTSLAVTEK